MCVKTKNIICSNLSPTAIPDQGMIIKFSLVGDIIFPTKEKIISNFLGRTDTHPDKEKIIILSLVGVLIARPNEILIIFYLGRILVIARPRKNSSCDALPSWKTVFFLWTDNSGVEK